MEKQTTEKIKNEILERFYFSKNKNYNKLSENEWDELEEYIEDYIVEEDTTFERVIEAYYECISQWER